MKFHSIIKTSVSMAVILFLGGFGFQWISRTTPVTTEPTETIQTRYVYTKVVKNRTWVGTVKLYGQLQPKRQVDIISEVKGNVLMDEFSFEMGQEFKKGDTLIRVDNRSFLFSHLSDKSQFTKVITGLISEYQFDFPTQVQKWVVFLSELQLNKTLPNLPILDSEKEQRYISARNVLRQYYALKSQEVMLEKYHFRAPFDGQVVSTTIDNGDLVQVGQFLGTLIQPGQYEVITKAQLVDIPFIQEGMPAKVISPGIAGQWMGAVSFVNGAVDRSTQTVSVGVDVISDQLKSGIYVDVMIQMSPIKQVVEVPLNTLNDDGTVYLVKQGKLKRVSVTIVTKTDELAIVRGILNGSQLVVRPVPGAYDGMAVTTLRESPGRSL